MKVKSESEVTQSCPTLRDPMDCSLPGSSVHGIFWARVLEWGAIAFSNKLPRRHLTGTGRPLCWRRYPKHFYPHAISGDGLIWTGFWLHSGVSRCSLNLVAVCVRHCKHLQGHHWPCDSRMPSCSLLDRRGGFTSSLCEIQGCIICSKYPAQAKAAFWVGIKRLSSALENNEGKKSRYTKKFVVLDSTHRFKGLVKKHVPLISGDHYIQYFLCKGTKFQSLFKEIYYSFWYFRQWVFYPHSKSRKFKSIKSSSLWNYKKIRILDRSNFFPCQMLATLRICYWPSNGNM